MRERYSARLDVAGGGQAYLGLRCWPRASGRPARRPKLFGTWCRSPSDSSEHSINTARDRRRRVGKDRERELAGTSQRVKEISREVGGINNLKVLVDLQAEKTRRPRGPLLCSAPPRSNDEPSGPGAGKCFPDWFPYCMRRHTFDSFILRSLAISQFRDRIDPNVLDFTGKTAREKRVPEQLDTLGVTGSSPVAPIRNLRPVICSSAVRLRPLGSGVPIDRTACAIRQLAAGPSSS